MMRQFDVRPDRLLEVVGNGSLPVTPRSIYPVQQAVSSESNANEQLRCGDSLVVVFGPGPS